MQKKIMNIKIGSLFKDQTMMTKLGSTRVLTRNMMKKNKNIINRKRMKCMKGVINKRIRVNIYGRGQKGW
jgi:hypothetical protein